MPFILFESQRGSEKIDKEKEESEVEEMKKEEEEVEEIKKEDQESEEKTEELQKENLESEEKTEEQMQKDAYELINEGKWVSEDGPICRVEFGSVYEMKTKKQENLEDEKEKISNPAVELRIEDSDSQNEEIPQSNVEISMPDTAKVEQLKQ